MIKIHVHDELAPVETRKKNLVIGKNKLFVYFPNLFEDSLNFHWKAMNFSKKSLSLKGIEICAFRSTYVRINV